MKYLTTFQPTRFGDWVVKLSYSKEDGTLFVLFAHNPINNKVIIRTFVKEMDVIHFVATLRERQDND